jgi:Sec-independent protein translocase protein TatA
VGKALNEFKRASNEFKAQIQSEISQLELEERHQILPPAQPPAGSIAKSLNSESGGTAATLPPPTHDQHSELKAAPDA